MSSLRVLHSSTSRIVASMYVERASVSAPERIGGTSNTIRRSRYRARNSRIMSAIIGERISSDEKVTGAPPGSTTRLPMSGWISRSSIFALPIR